MLRALLYYKLQSNFHQLESAFEKLLKLLDRKVNHLLLVNIVKGLEVNPLVSNIEKSINLY